LRSPDDVTACNVAVILLDEPNVPAERIGQAENLLQL
jgi:hypothetical protein